MCIRMEAISLLLPFSVVKGAVEGSNSANRHGN